MAISAWVDVCNMALYRLGAMPITALTDETKSAAICNAVYAQCVDEVLEDNDWACARARETVAVDATAPDFEWLYRYAMPSSTYCLRVISIDGDTAYEIEGRWILTDQEDEIDLKFCKRITDPSELSPLLAKAISLWIAAMICRHIVPSKTIRDEIMKEYEAVVDKAKGAQQCQDYVTDEKENSSDTGNAEWITYGRS